MDTETTNTTDLTRTLRAGLEGPPAWQRALRDFDQLVRLPQGQFDWIGRQVEGWRLPDNLRLPDGWMPRLGNWSLDRLPQVNLPRWNLRAPDCGGINLGGGPRLGVGRGNAPDIDGKRGEADESASGRDRRSCRSC